MLSLENVTQFGELGDRGFKVLLARIGVKI
jgi:hypothetical protein